MKIARKFVISGRVQGVGFRYFAERCGNQLGLAGYVRNQGDGTVEVYAIGDAAVIVELKQLLAKGPPCAHVENILESDEPVDKQYKQFTIKGGW